MSYFGHMKFALKFALTLQLAVFAAIIHSVLPCFFRTTASSIVRRLNLLR